MTPVDNPVAKVLNRFSARAFIEALTEHDYTVGSELLEEFFCICLDEKEQGKHLYITLNFIIIMKCVMDRVGE